MASKTVVITGDDEVKRRLAAMGAKAQPALVLAIKAGALIVQTDAKVRAPKLTGNLARSIHIEPLPGETGVAVGTDVEYAMAQEYGQPELHIPAQPYLRPAMDQNLGRVGATIAATLKKLIQP